MNPTTREANGVDGQLPSDPPPTQTTANPCNGNNGHGLLEKASVDAWSSGIVHLMSTQVRGGGGFLGFKRLLPARCGLADAGWGQQCCCRCHSCVLSLVYVSTFLTTCTDLTLSNKDRYICKVSYTNALQFLWGPSITFSRVCNHFMLLYYNNRVCLPYLHWRRNKWCCVSWLLP